MSYDGREPIFVVVDGIVQFSETVGNKLNRYVLLIKRLKDPDKGMWAFPGGHLDADDESLESACAREVLEETGIYVDVWEPLDVRDEVYRDPRGRYIDHPFKCYQTWKEFMQKPMPRTDASAAKWFNIYEARKMDLAFDHNLILINAFWKEEYLRIKYPKAEWR